MPLDLWLQEEVVGQGIDIHSVCKFAFYVHSCHNFACNAVATFSDGHLLLLAYCYCVLLRVYGRLAVVFCRGRQMVLRRCIAGESVLVGVYSEQL